MSEVRLLSAGAAKAVVTALEPRFSAAGGPSIDAAFGPAGQIRARCRDGEAFDVVILTEELLAELAASGTVDPGSVRIVGRGRSGIAVRRGVEKPAIGDRASLEQALLAAEAIYCPDTRVATSGIHFASVIERLGIGDAVRTRITEASNGAAAMRLLTESTGRTLGVTQITEILDAPGVELVGGFPAEFELVTVYAAASAANAANKQAAAELVALLTGPESVEVRAQAGFDVEAPA